MEFHSRVLCCLTLLSLAVAASACGDTDEVSSEEQARQAYLGLDRMVEKAMDLGFDGFNAASSANIPEQSTAGDVQGTLKVNGKVDQGSSNNKGMRLTTGLTDYADLKRAETNDPAVVYDTLSALPALDMSLKKIPDGTMTGTLNGIFSMTGDLTGDVTLNLALAAALEPDPATTGGVRRKAGTITITGSATSSYGVFAVNVSR